MPVTVVGFLCVLFLAGAVLMWEARTGRFTAASARWDVGRGVLFFLATVVGGALLIRSMGGTVLLALAFIPVTLLSLMRFVTLMRQRWSGAATVVAMALALFGGIALSLRAVPEPIDEGYFLEHIFHSGGEAGPDSIDPDARRSIRM
jgi:hypothetical protein